MLYLHLLMAEFRLKWMMSIGHPLAVYSGCKGVYTVMEQSISEPLAMQLAIRRDSDTPTYRQIESQIRSLILEGRLPAGARLPAERVLARHLGVNRTTVVNAYRELAADGLIAGRAGRGTVVLGVAERAEASAEPAPVPLAWSGLIRPRLRSIQSPLVRRVADLAARPGTISLAAGIPEILTSPHIALDKTVGRLLDSCRESLLQDSPVLGLMHLREELARRLALKGCSRPAANQILILSGSQQGLYLVAQLLLEPGQAVLVESPTYVGALEVFRALGARLIEVPVDEQGMRVSAAEQIMAHVDVRLIYTIPNFQNPTGSVMSAERRAALLALAQRHRVPILEDDLYGELFYEANPPAPMRALDRGGFVLYLGSLSSVLGPGLRLGWLVAPPALIEPLAALRRTVDLHPSNLTQQAVCELLGDGSLDAHLAWVRRAWASRRDALLDALESHMPPSVRWGRPQGGLYVWCSLAAPLNSRELLEEAANEEVVFVPGNVFFADGQGEAYMRLSFAHLSALDIAEGVRRLARAVKRLEKQPKHDGPSVGEHPIV